MKTDVQSMVGHEEWLAARKELLAREKEFTRLRDELTRQQRALPWERVEREYVFDGPDGRETLAELFAGRSQLVVYHFMFPRPRTMRGARPARSGRTASTRTSST